MLQPRLITTIRVSILIAAGLFGPVRTASAAVDPCPYPLMETNRPVAPPTAPTESASFIDPTAELQSDEFVRVGKQIYIAPFARLEAQSATDNICIEHSANVQDNTLLKVNGGPIHVGEEAIIAHGAQLVGDGTPVSIAHRDACQLPPPGPDPNKWSTPAERGRQALANALAETGVVHADCTKIPAFIGFNALNQSHIEDGALLDVTSRLARGVILRAGYSSFPGKSLNTQFEADTPGGDPTQFKVWYVTAGDIIFMEAVLHVNECLAKGYTDQYRDNARAVHPFGGPESIHGIGIDPGSYHRCEFNNLSERPTIGYPFNADLNVRDLQFAVADPNPPKKIRIIGDARMVDIERIQDNVSIRSDEGEPMTFRADVEFGFANTFHALEMTPEDAVREVRVGANPEGVAPALSPPSSGVKLEERVVTHGGGRRTRIGGPDPEPTFIERFVIVGKDSVVFRSHLAENTRVGTKAVLAGYDNGCDADGNCAPGEVIPDRCVKFNDTPAHQCAYFVEW
jgi:hypothetical protein